jgi:hypothetical protein
MQMLIDMERIEAMSDEELIKVSKEDMARFVCTHTAEQARLLGLDCDEHDLFIRTINRPGLIEERDYRQWFYRTVWNRQLELTEAKEYGEATKMSFGKSYGTGSVKDVTAFPKPELLCFDLKYLSPKQKEALYRLIDDDQDLVHGCVNSDKGAAVTVASKSMISAMSPDQYLDREINLITRLAR